MGGWVGSGKESGRNEWTVRKAPGRRGREGGQENREGTVELRGSAGRLASVSYHWLQEARVGERGLCWMEEELDLLAGGVTSEYPDKEKPEPRGARGLRAGSVQRADQHVAALVYRMTTWAESGAAVRR